MKKLTQIATITTLSLILSNSLVASDLVEYGDKVFNTKKLGNCLACHDVNGKKINSPGSLGPKLSGLKYWDEKTLYDTVYDIYKSRGIKNSAMPPFGTNGWLSDKQITAVVAYLKTID